ncbi:hypothetical protein QJS66_17300 [Kocuria rhizophila]|nr:hypothetical protein QJS66_17300 [Kocuria rhizophila]
MTAFFTAGDGWIPHRAGQWARIGVEVDGSCTGAPLPQRSRARRPLDHRQGPGHRVRAPRPPGCSRTCLTLERPEGQLSSVDAHGSWLFMVVGFASPLGDVDARAPSCLADRITTWSWSYVARSRGSRASSTTNTGARRPVPGLRPVLWFTEERGRLTPADPGEVVAAPSTTGRARRTRAAQTPSSRPWRHWEGLRDAPVVERFDVARAATGGRPGDLSPAQRPDLLAVGGARHHPGGRDAPSTPRPTDLPDGTRHSCLIPMTDGAVTNIRTGRAPPGTRAHPDLRDEALPLRRIRRLTPATLPSPPVPTSWPAPLNKGTPDDAHQPPPTPDTKNSAASTG